MKELFFNIITPLKTSIEQNDKEMLANIKPVVVTYVKEKKTVFLKPEKWEPNGVEFDIFFLHYLGKGY